MRQILYSVARNEEGELVRAADADRKSTYFCRLCDGVFILRKSDRVGPGTKRPHFAHKTLTPNCTPESALHFEFKNLLLREIEDRLERSSELPLSWKCIYCDRKHSGNLLKTARTASLEHSLGPCRPDIALFDTNGRVVAALEVVVTHKPDPAARDHYRHNKITLVELHLTSEADLDNIVGKLEQADHVQLCIDRKRCTKCGHFQRPVVMRILDAKCYSCRSKMKVPYIEGDYSRGSHIGPEGFTRQERKIAADNGALIEWQYSRTLNKKYWAATCGRCRKFVGRNYLYDHHIVGAAFDDPNTINVPLGDFCDFCEQAKQQTLDS